MRLAQHLGQVLRTQLAGSAAAVTVFREANLVSHGTRITTGPVLGSNR
jgi:hypothetical protein